MIATFSSGPIGLPPARAHGSQPGALESREMPRHSRIDSPRQLSDSPTLHLRASRPLFLGALAPSGCEPIAAGRRIPPDWEWHIVAAVRRRIGARLPQVIDVLIGSGL